MAPITVVIAGEARTRALCRRLLRPEEDIAVSGEAPSGPMIPAVVTRLRPDVLLLDFARPRLDVLAHLPAIRSRARRTRILLLTAERTSEALLLEALHRGAHGYLGHVAAGTLLARAIRAVQAGEAWVPRRMVARILERLRRLAAAVRPGRRPGAWPVRAPGARHGSRIQGVGR